MTAARKVDFDNAKLDLEHIAAVAKSREATHTDRDGQVTPTLYQVLSSIGYLPPVAYGAGIVFGEGDFLKTVERTGTKYAPRPSALPFTTSGTWTGSDEPRFYPAQGVTSDKLALPGATQGIGHSYPEAPAVLWLLSDAINGDEVHLWRAMTQPQIAAIKANEWDDVDSVSDPINDLMDTYPNIRIRASRGHYRCTSQILTGVSNGGMLMGEGREATVFRNAVEGAPLFKTPAGIRNYTIANLGADGEVGSQDIFATTADFGHIRLINLLLRPKRYGFDFSSGNGIDVYIESVRTWRGTIGLKCDPTGDIPVNTLNVKNFYAEDGNIGFALANIASGHLDCCSADNNDTYGALLSGNVTMTGFTCEKNGSNGVAILGSGTMIVNNFQSLGQAAPILINSDGARVILNNPRTGSTPSGASLNIVAAEFVELNGDVGLLDAGLSTAARNFLAPEIYIDAADANVTLTQRQNDKDVVIIFGTMTADRFVNVKRYDRKTQWTFVNATTGGFGIVVRVDGTGGASVTVAAGKTAILRSDATNIIRVTGDFS